MSIKVALVYDRVNKWGGAERVLLALHQIFPDAPLYTSLYNPKSAPWATVFPKVYTSFLQKIPFFKSRHEALGWLMPLAFESFNFDRYDLVISVTSEAAKGIITRPETKHLCYLLTPTRYLWSHYQFYFRNPLLRWLSSPVINWLRKWDKVAAYRPDKIVAISTEVQERIAKYYQRESEIIFPPLSSFPESILHKFGDEFFLVVSRLVPYKKVDLVVRAFNKLKQPLVIVGTGAEELKLRRLAKKNIKFAGQVGESELSYYYTRAKALIMPQEEDFGLVSLEAQSFAVPVIAYDRGGVKDTVVDGKSGLLFSAQNVESLVKTVTIFDKSAFNAKELRTAAKKFSQENFAERIKRVIAKL